MNNYLPSPSSVSPLKGEIMNVTLPFMGRAAVGMGFLCNPIFLSQFAEDEIIYNDETGQPRAGPYTRRFRRAISFLMVGKASMLVCGRKSADRYSSIKLRETDSST
jgi:hypothetical protein